MRSEPNARDSDAARDRILGAARHEFADHGFDRTTVRAVALRASINPALVIRYFGSKEGLFSSAVQFDLDLPDVSRLEPSRIGEGLVTHFLQVWEDGPRTGDLQALLRAGTTHEAARKRLAEIFQEQLAPAIARLCQAGEAQQRAALVASQMLGLALGRYVLKLPGLVAMDREAIVRLIGPSIKRYATGEIFDEIG